MKCPLLLMQWQSQPNKKTFEPMDCQKEKCAWWHTGLEDCRLAVLEDSISTIAGTLLNFSLDLEKSGKLPHWKPVTDEEVSK